MAKKETILKSIEKGIKIRISESIKPEDFFRDCKGLYVWNSFINNIVNKAKETKQGVAFNLASFDLTKTSIDEEIEKALPKKHIFSETDVCAIIAELISQQPKGEFGPLESDGNWNLFYTPSHVVDVHWDGSYWGVGGWGRGGGWGGGDRVFSPATES